jgi:hypothetical protein
MCGIISHTDRACGVILTKGEVQQFSKKLWCIPERIRLEDRGVTCLEGYDMFHTRKHRVLVAKVSRVVLVAGVFQKDREVVALLGGRIWRRKGYRRVWKTKKRRMKCKAR